MPETASSRGLKHRRKRSKRDELSGLIETEVLDEELQPSEWDTLQAAFAPESAREHTCGRSAMLDWLRHGDYLLASGYADAATILTNWSLRVPRHEDALAYPVLFLFRHYLELRLKDIIWMANVLCERGFPDHTRPDLSRLWSRHGLPHLWQQVRDLAAELGLPGGKSWEYVGRCIHEFSEVDPKSQAFRYLTDPTGKDLHPIQPGSRGKERVRHVNLGALGRVMARVVTMLEGLRTELGEMQDGLDEMQGFEE